MSKQEQKKDIAKLNAFSKKYAEQLNKAIAEVEKVIVGQEDILKKLIIALIADGHILFEGVPGLAKTLMINTLSKTLEAKYKRIQFTPDLLPANLIGTKIYNQKDGSFSTKKGPIFANFILADEINRAPPKVQSALLEAMQEKQVTISGDTYKIDKPFLVLATQNPLETEGTYRLPEAQVDRFMMKVLIDYPSRDEEQIIINRMTTGMDFHIKKVMPLKAILDVQGFVKQIYVDDSIKEYVVSIIDATRNPKDYNLDIEHFIDYGASPRATIWMIMGAKANALLEGRGYVIPDDIKYIAKAVLRHRIILTYEAEAESITTDNIIDEILNAIEVP